MKLPLASDWLLFLPSIPTYHSGLPSICLHMESLPVGHFLFTSESVNEGHPGMMIDCDLLIHRQIVRSDLRCRP